jgi:hypothetical protein
MPRSTREKKAAAQQLANTNAYDTVIRDPSRYKIARVEKALGFCGFQAVIEDNGFLREIQVLVRGKFKGGRNAATNVDVGCFVIADGDTRQKVMEVVGVLRDQRQFTELKRRGRIPLSLLKRDAAAVIGASNVDYDDDIFDRSDEIAEDDDVFDPDAVRKPIFANDADDDEVNVDAI